MYSYVYVLQQPYNKCELKNLHYILMTCFDGMRSSSGEKKHILTWNPKAGIVKSEETCIVRQMLGKHIPAAMNMQATIE
jgi:hypothetical protein